MTQARRRSSAPAKFRSKPQVVVAQQWYPGVTIRGVFTDPQSLCSQLWAHVGYQRELDGTCALVLAGDEEPTFVHPGDWIVKWSTKRVEVVPAARFRRLFEPVA